MSRTIRIQTTGFELDAFEHRRHLKCFSRAGVATAAKRAYNRRARRFGRQELLAELFEMEV